MRYKSPQILKLDPVYVSFCSFVETCDVQLTKIHPQNICRMSQTHSYNARVHKHTHTHTHTHTHILPNTLHIIHTYKCAYMHAHIQACTHTHTHRIGSIRIVSLCIALWDIQWNSRNYQTQTENVTEYFRFCAA